MRINEFLKIFYSCTLSKIRIIFLNVFTFRAFGVFKTIITTYKQYTLNIF